MHEMFDRIVTLRVGDVMTAEPVTVNASSSMAEVAHLFTENRLHSAPVVDDTGCCVGIITAKDVKVLKVDGGHEVAATYSHKAPFIANISFVVDFDKRALIRR